MLELEVAITEDRPVPRVSIRAVIIEDSRILLCKHHDDRGFWYITPGGAVEQGETLEEAFKREMREELDADVAFHKLLGMREIIADRHPIAQLPKGFHQLELFAEASLLSRPTGNTPVPDPNQIGIEWVELKRLDEILFFPIGMVRNFQDGDWARFYFGEIR